MSLHAVIFGPRSKEYIQDFLALPKRIYVKEELVQNEKAERAILKGTHALSHYFTITPILVYDEERAVSRGIVTVYPKDEVAYLGFFESKDNSAAAGLLFHTALGLVRDMGLKGIVGPVDCSSWIKYRLKTNQFRSPCTGEPYNKEYYLKLWEENGFQIWEPYASTYYKTAKGDEGSEKDKDRLARKQEGEYEIKSPRARDFRRTQREVYGLLTQLYASLPAYKEITEKEFCGQFKYLKPMLNYSMVKVAYYQGEAVGFLMAVPNFGNKICGKVFLWQRPWVLIQKRKPRSYVMFCMGVDPKYRGLGKALAEAVRVELKLQQIQPVGTLIHSDSENKDYMKPLIDFEYEYLLLERQV